MKVLILFLFLNLTAKIILFIPPNQIHGRKIIIIEK